MPRWGRACNWVYPRACGGTCPGPRAWAASMGLSPRVRGNLGKKACQPVTQGSIPARAGEPRRPPMSRTGLGVYPRACGGTRRRGGTLHQRQGLSPRVRGNHVQAIPRGGQFGSIPARAGEPQSIADYAAEHGVYPRACGGTSRRSTEAAYHSGLSPRVRGNRRLRRRRAADRRSIPARAGEP